MVMIKLSLTQCNVIKLIYILFFQPAVFIFYFYIVAWNHLYQKRFHMKNSVCQCVCVCLCGLDFVDLKFILHKCSKSSEKIISSTVTSGTHFYLLNGLIWNMQFWHLYVNFFLLNSLFFMPGCLLFVFTQTLNAPFMMTVCGMCILIYLLLFLCVFFFIV